jgi:NAD(P)-dependent dehydrogenase (short-subunit alcohol dehydrogenase family)
MCVYDHFQGKVAIVTGGASGIGNAVVKRFVEAGASVIIADVAANGPEVAERFRANEQAVEFITTDVRDASATQAMVALAERVYGGVDILVNSAGIFPKSKLLATTDEFWNKVIDINLKGTFHACQAVVPAMIKRGGGAIINIGSLHTRGGSPDLFAYSSSKGGVWTMTRNLALGLVKEKIRVNCVHPGWVASEGERALRRSEGLPENWDEVAGQKLRSGRLQTPDDIAAAVIFFASDHAQQITGQELTVDGGMSL